MGELKSLKIKEKEEKSPDRRLNNLKTAIEKLVFEERDSLQS